MNPTNATARFRRRTLRGDIVFAFAVGFALYLAWLLRSVLLLLYVSALFAVALKPLVGFISQLHIGSWHPFKRTAILVLLLLVAGGLATFAFLAIPPVARDLHDFAQEMPARLPPFVEKLKSIPLVRRIDVSEVTARIEGQLTHAATYMLLSIRNWAGYVAKVAMCLILTVYFTLEGEVAYRWCLSFFAPERRDRLDAALRRAEARMEKWLLGQGSLMLILCLASTITYSALHVRYAYALGFLTGLLNIIPVVGAAVCIVLALLVAAVDSWGRVLGVAIFYVVYLNVENSFLTPRIMKSRVGLPGLSILVALLVGSELAGVVGALVSVPTAVLVTVLVDEYLIARQA